MLFIFSKKSFIKIVIMLVHNFCLLSSNSNAIWNTCPKEPFMGKYLERCYEDLGCLKITPEWTHYKYRPFNLLPASRHAINTVFVQWIYKSKKVEPNIIGPCCCNQSEMRGQLKLLIHDFTSNGYTGWIQHLALGFLSTASPVEPVCVVSVDWSAGAEPPYAQAVANARVVALEINNFFKKLKAIGNVNIHHVHIIGHGVGAHIAGYVGKFINIQKITGLDPSGPHFRGMPPNVKLYIDDATFVEVLHTNIQPYCGQGNDELMGHVDFYANGGLLQPNCKECTTPFITKLSRGDLKLGENVPGCSHKRSVKYYIEALFNPTCIFLGVACTSYKDFIEGRCLDCGKNYELCYSLHPLSQPRYLNNSSGFYFITSNSPNFCTEMFRVTLNLRTETNKLKGSFNVTVLQDFAGNTSISFILNENGHLLNRKFKKQSEYTFLVIRPTPPSLHLPAKSVHINWRSRRMSYQIPKPPKVNYITINKITDKNPIQVQTFCANDPDDISTQLGSDNCLSEKKNIDDELNQLNQHKIKTLW